MDDIPSVISGIMDCRRDIADLMSKCIGCGKCTEVCTSHRYGGCDPMAVIQGDFSSAPSCLGCGMCNDACGYLEPKRVVMYAANRAAGLDVPEIYRKTGYNLPKSNMSNVPVPHYCKDADAVLMPGCIVNAIAPYLEYATVRAFSLLGISLERYRGGCCTYPVAFRNLSDEQRDDIKRRDLDSVKGRKLYAICSGCADEMVRSGYDSVHVFRVFFDNLALLKKLPGCKLRVAIQTGCGMVKEYDSFRAIAEACGCEVVEVEQGCCGKSVPGIADKIMSDRQADLKGADAVVVGCPSCFARYDARSGGVPVIYISELVCLAAGDISTLGLHTIV